MYHFTLMPIKVHWKILDLVVYSMSKFKENHKWNVMAWLAVSSATFP